jgi:hypothetical protein
MAMVDGNGNTLTQAQLEAKTSIVTQPQVRRFTEDVYETFGQPGAKKLGGGKRLKYRSGQEVPQTEIDALYTGSAITVGSVTVTPNSGPQAGGTNVTVKSSGGFDGVTAVSIGGVALTNLVIKDDKTITGRTGAHAAGAVTATITDSSGNVTTGNVFTYV